MNRDFTDNELKERARVDMAVRGLYRGAGLVQPKQIIWMPSPLAMTEAAQAGRSVKHSLGHAWLGATQPQAPHPLVALFRRLHDEGAALPVLQELQRGGAKHVNDIVLFRKDARMIDFYNLFLNDTATARENSPMYCNGAPFSSLQFIIPHEQACYVSAAPQGLQLDPAGRMHRQDGPAAVYDDGWKVYALEGNWMPAYMMEHATKLALKRRSF